MSARDKRVSLMNEVLQSVRMIKYMAIEQPFEDRIMESRSFPSLPAGMHPADIRNDRC